MLIDPAYIQLFLLSLILFGFWLIFPKDLKIFTLSLFNSIAEFGSNRYHSTDYRETDPDAKLIEALSSLTAKIIGLAILVVGTILLFSF